MGTHPDVTASGHRVLKATAVCMTICVCSIQQSLCLSSLAAKASPAVYTANAETCSKLVFIAHQDSSCNHVSSAHKLQKVASRLHDMTLHTSHSCTAAEPDALQHPVTMFCNGVQRSALTSSTCLQKVWGHGPRGGRGGGGGHVELACKGHVLSLLSHELQSLAHCLGCECGEARAVCHHSHLIMHAPACTT